jgi:hypothetical protein
MLLNQVFDGEIGCFAYLENGSDSRGAVVCH